MLNLAALYTVWYGLKISLIEHFVSEIIPTFYLNSFVGLACRKKIVIALFNFQKTGTVIEGYLLNRKV